MDFRCAGEVRLPIGIRRRVSLTNRSSGPYRLWIHEHRFEERDGGTLMHDDVRYAVLFDFLIHRFFIRPDIERIFAYRERNSARFLRVKASSA